MPSYVSPDSSFRNYGNSGRRGCGDQRQLLLPVAPPLTYLELVADPTWSMASVSRGIPGRVRSRLPAPHKGVHHNRGYC